VIGPFCLGFSVASSLAPLLPFARLAGAMQFKQRGTSNQNTTPRQSKNHSRAGLRSHLAACLPPRHCSWEALLERGLQGQHGAGLSRRWTVCSMGWWSLLSQADRRAVAIPGFGLDLALRSLTRATWTRRPLPPGTAGLRWRWQSWWGSERDSLLSRFRATGF